MFGRDSWIYQHPGPAIGKVFAGNKELAEAYWGVGMAMLFNVKSRMREGLLGSLNMNRVMGDGTVIQVQSFYGQDLIRIDAPFLVPMAVKEPIELRFKITRDDGVVMTPENNRNTNFAVHFPNGNDFSGEFPFFTGDYLIITFDDESQYWTVRKRALNQDGTPDHADMVGDFFDPDDQFWVSYSFTGIGADADRIWVNTTQYPGITEGTDMLKEKDLISHGDYEDEVIGNRLPPPAGPWIYLFDILDRLGQSIESGVTCSLIHHDSGLPYGGVVPFGYYDGHWRLTFPVDPAISAFEYDISFVALSEGPYVSCMGYPTCTYYYTPYPRESIALPPLTGGTSGPYEVSLRYFRISSADFRTVDTNLNYVVITPDSPQLPSGNYSFFMFFKDDNCFGNWIFEYCVNFLGE
jgi:hypothetical protein